MARTEYAAGMGAWLKMAEDYCRRLAGEMRANHETPESDGAGTCANLLAELREKVTADPVALARAVRYVAAIARK